MDGTSIMHIATKDIGWPNGLAVDFTCEVDFFFTLKKILFLSCGKYVTYVAFLLL